MSEPFDNLIPADNAFVFSNGDREDVRLGEYIAKTRYEDASIVIVGCAEDEGVRRGRGREGAAKAPAEIRSQLYMMTPFGIHHRVADIGDVPFSDSLEETHTRLTAVVKKIIADGKKAVVIGGGNDITYASGRAMSESYGAGNWLCVNADSHLDVRDAPQCTNETPLRQLIEEKLIRGDYLYAIGFQPHFVSPVHYRFLQNMNVNLVSIDQLRSRETADLELRELMRQRFVHHSKSLTALFSFDLHAVRCSDAPGVSDPSPIGLRSGEFLNLVHFAAKLINTKVIEFTELNPNFDADGRSAKLVAVAIHHFLASQPHV